MVDRQIAALHAARLAQTQVEQVAAVAPGIVVNPIISRAMFAPPGLEGVTTNGVW